MKLSRKTALGIAILLFITGMAAWLRLDGLAWGLPYRLHPDEMKYVATGAEVHGVFRQVTDENGQLQVVEEAKWNPKYFRNPPGFSYLNALWYPLWIWLYEPVDVSEHGVETLQYDKRDITQTYYAAPWDMVMGGRVLAAALGVGTLLLLFWSGYRMLGWQGGLVAAFLNGVSFISVREAHFAVNDTCTVFFVMVSFVLIIEGWMRQKKHWFYAAAAGAGLAVVSKYNAVPVVLTVMVVWGMTRWRQNLFIWKQFISDVLLYGLISVGVFLIVCPFPIIDAPTFFAELQDLAVKSGETWPGQEPVWSGFLLAEALYVSEGALGVLAALAGLILLVRQGRYEILVFPVLYALLVITHALFFMRFALPLLPFMHLMMSAGLLYGVRCLSGQKNRQYGLLALGCVLTGIQPFYATLQSNALFHETNTRIQCLQWVAEQADSQADFRMAVDQYCVPFPYRGGVRTPGQSVYDTTLVMIDSLPSEQLPQLETLAGTSIEAVGLSTFVTFPAANESTYPERRQAVASYTGSARPEKVFSSFESGWRPQAADVEDTYHPVYDLSERVAPGPTIEIFMN